MRRLRLRIRPDQDVDSPNEDENWWKLISFNRRHHGYEPPENFDLRTHPGLRTKLRVGLAFVLDYYEHGGIAWARKGHAQNDPWDTSHNAGILVFQGKPSDIGAKTYEERAKCADGFIDTYNHWANGNCWYFSLDEDRVMPCGHTETHHVDSCGGFIGSDIEEMGMAEYIVPNLQPGDFIKFDGEGEWMADSLREVEGVTIVDDFDEIEDETETTTTENQK